MAYTSNKNKLAHEKEYILSGTEELVHNVNLGNLILNAFKSRPDFIGQINAETEEQITFRQMRENSVKCALWLQQFCSKNSTIVIAICTRNQMDAYIPFLAALYVGAIINPWDEKYFEDNIRVMYFLAEYEPEIIFVDRHNYFELKRAINLLNFNSKAIHPPKIVTFGRIDGSSISVDSLELILNDDFDKAKIDKFSCEKMNPMNIMATMFSPNAISYPGKANIRYFAFTYPSNQEVPAMSSGDIGLWFGSLCSNYGLILTVRSIISYVTAIKYSKFSDEKMYHAIEKYKVTWVFLENSMCNQLFEIDIRMYNVSSLKQLVFDSAINHNIYKKLFVYFKNISIVQIYSISEASIVVSYKQHSNSLDRIASVGYLAKNIQLQIRDEKKTNLIPNFLGEIWYKLICKWCNPQTCKLPHCYNYKAKKDSINLRTCVAITSTWHCTGDYGYYNEKDGEIFIIDKIRNLIKYKLFTILPSKIENSLRCHPAVSEVVVRSVRHNNDGEHPMAYVKKKYGAKVTEEELMRYLTKYLPDIYKLRGGLYFIKNMPYLPNGKIDRVLVQHWPPSDLIEKFK